MRNRGFKPVKLCLMTLGLLAFVSGCMVSHSDTLVFGTNTKLAVDLSLNSTTNVPSLTVGYTRQEGVWMPLYVNARDSKFSNSSSSRVFKNFTSNTSGLKYAGNQGGDRDTYSVLASFGADITAGSDSSVGIAQYFATGLAARQLAQNAHVAETLSIQSPNKQTLEVQKKATETLEKVLTYKERLDAENKAKEQVKLDDAKIELIISKMAPGGKVTGLDTIFKKPELKSFEQWQPKLNEAKTADDLRNILRDDAQSVVEPLFKAHYKEQ